MIRHSKEENITHTQEKIQPVETDSEIMEWEEFLQS